MKKVKRITISILFIFALIGVFSLLKRPPQLAIPEEDAGYLRDVYGTDITTGDSSASGVSALMDGALEGVPSLSGSSLSGSSTPPLSFGVATPAPAYASQHAEAPAFQEAPAFGSEAPAFPAPVPSPKMEAPIFEPTTSPVKPVDSNTDPSVKVAGVPHYGSRLILGETPAFPNTSEALPSVLPGTTKPTASDLIPNDLKVSEKETPPLSNRFYPQQAVPDISPPSAAGPPNWDGPTSTVSMTPSSVSVEPRRASDITDGNGFGSAAPGVTMPEAAPPAPPPADSFSSTEVSSVEEVVGPSPFTAILGLVATAPPPPPPIPAEPTAPVAAAAPAIPESDDYLKQEFKRLPGVKKPVERTSAPRQEPSIEPAPAAPPASEDLSPVSGRVIPRDYQQTSMRHPPASSASDAKIILRTDQDESERKPFPESKAPEQPAISFSTTRQGEPEDRNQTPIFVAPTLTPREPEPAETPKAAASKSDDAVRPAVRDYIVGQEKSAATEEPDKMRHALIGLTRLYDHPELNAGERAQLTPVLDRLALDVIFSCRHHVLEEPYIVGSGDTIDSIAASYHLSAALLMKINGLTGARPLKPGTPLKVVLGRFDAKVSAQRNELTLVLGGLYAGRFPVTVGREIADLKGEFVVSSKSESFKGKTLILNNGVKLRALDEMVGASESESATAMGFSVRDASELFDILTERSVIVFEN